MPGNFKNAYALLIAVDQNSEPTAALPAVAADAKALREVLVHPQRCAYPPENVRLLSAAESTRNGIFDGLDWLNEKLAVVADGDSTAVVYFTGHGYVEGGEHYLIPYDLNRGRIRTSAIRASEFAAEIARLTPCRLLVALDCCHASGMAIKGVATSTFAGAAVPAALFLPDSKALHGTPARSGRAVLSSCQPQQLSYLRADRRMSIFTYHLVEALTGHAQASTGAAEVLVSDLISHLDRKVPESALAQHGAQQMPEHRLTGNFPIALILGGGGLGKGTMAPDPLAPLPAATSFTASLAGNGAIAQGKESVAVGSHGVYVGGNSNGSINNGTLTQIFNQTGEDAEAAKSVIAQYLDALVKDLAGLQLGEIDAAAATTRQEPLKLADVYVALDTTQHIPQEMALAQWLARDRAHSRDEIASERETRPVAALEALAAHRQLTLLGKPGSGKSTFGASVLLALAQAWQGHDGELVKLGATWTHGALLPIRVILRRFAERLPAGDAPARAGDLWAFIGHELEASGHGVSADAVNYLQQLASSHGALFLFDGLDECGDSARRDRVLAAVNEMVRNSGPNCRFVLTARPYAKLDGAGPSAGVYLLADLEDIEFERDTNEAGAAGNTSCQATLNGNGAIAQGKNAVAVGSHGVHIGGNSTGNINTGTQTKIHTGGGAYVAGGVTTNGDFIGRDRISHSIFPGDLEPLFVLLLDTMASKAPMKTRAAAVQLAQALEWEVAKGEQADDHEIAKIVDEIAETIPGAIKTVSKVFAAPTLRSTVGPETKFVLNKKIRFNPPANTLGSKAKSGEIVERIERDSVFASDDFLLLDALNDDPLVKDTGTAAPQPLGEPFASPVIDKATPDAGAVAPTIEKALEFVLEGPEAKGLTLLAGGSASLIFRQVLSNVANGMIVEGKKLAPLFAGTKSLSISLTPDDGLAIDGTHSATAQFADGVLLQPVAFALRALSGSTGLHGIHVELHHAGALLYEFRLLITLLEKGLPLPNEVSPTTIDLDAIRALQACAEVGKPKRRIRLKVVFENNLLYINLENYVDEELDYSIEGFASSIDRAKLDVLRGQTIATLGEDFYQSNDWSDFDGSNTTKTANTHILAAARSALAQAGGLLFRGLSDDPKFKSVLEYIEAADPGTRITITTHDVMLPWELIYPRRFDPDEPERWPLDPSRFWGARFALETLILGEGGYASLLTARRQAKEEVSLNFNPTISINGKPPRAVHDEFADLLRSLGPQVSINDECQTIRNAILKAETNATLIYLFCHGSPPTSAATPQVESLALANRCDVNADQIDEERTFRNAPIIFINACRTGSFSPLSFTGFLRAFREKKALGLIAPSFDVPISFAHRFGTDVVDACCQRKGISLADLLLELRQEHMQRGNPIPLFYAVQCQVDL